MVARFLDHVPDTVALDEVAAPSAVVDIDAGSRPVMDGVVAHGDAVRHGNVDRGGLFFVAAHEGHRVTGDRDVPRVILGLRARNTVGDGAKGVVPRGRAAHGGLVAEDQDVARAIVAEC